LFIVLYDNFVLYFQGDPLLCDLHTEVTLEEIKSQIALAHGNAITVNVWREDDIVLRKCYVAYCINLMHLPVDLLMSNGTA